MIGTGDPAMLRTCTAGRNRRCNRHALGSVGRVRREELEGVGGRRKPLRKVSNGGPFIRDQKLLKRVDDVQYYRGASRCACDCIYVHIYYSLSYHNEASKCA